MKKNEKDHARVPGQPDSNVALPRWEHKLIRSYDEAQIGAVLVKWPCCGREVYATHVERGCITCR